MMKDFLAKIYSNRYLAISLMIIYVLLYIYMRFRKKIDNAVINLLKKIRNYLSHSLLKIKTGLISCKHKVLSFVKKRSTLIKRGLKKSKGKIFFIAFYLPYIAFFVFLVVYERMQEADVAFKYIVFPLYFALPILFKSAFDRLEILMDRLDEQTGGKSKQKKKGDFSSADDMKAENKPLDFSKEPYNYAGIPIIYDGGKYSFIEDSESHSLIIGSTGCGKTRRIALPLINIIARASESFIVTDPKGELYSANSTILKNLGYTVRVLNFRNPDKGNSWNPLHLAYKYYKCNDKDKAIELLNDLGISIMISNLGNDPFWENSCVDYFIGLALALFEDASDENEVNFNSLFNMSRVGAKIRWGKSIIEHYFDSKDEDSVAAISASGTIYAPKDTKASILSVFHQKIRVFNANHSLSKMLASSDFDLSEIGKEKTAIFIIIQDEKSTYHPLASAFLKQSYEELVGVANTHSNGKLDIRVNYILDEFANLPPLADMDNIITASRSRYIRMYLFIQGIKQLNSIYGDNIAEIIKGNCDFWYYLMSKELPLLKEISELCGTKQNDENPMFNTNIPLVSITDLQLLKVGETLILQKRLSPFYAYLHDISKYPYFSISSEKIDPDTINRIEPTVFSIREYVTNHMLDIMHKKGDFDDDIINNLSSKDIDEKTAAIDKKRKELEEEEKKPKQEL